MSRSAANFSRHLAVQPLFISQARSAVHAAVGPRKSGARRAVALLLWFGGRRGKDSDNLVQELSYASADFAQLGVLLVDKGGNYWQPPGT
jgi:hypothetical protein